MTQVFLRTLYQVLVYLGILYSCVLAIFRLGKILVLTLPYLPHPVAQVTEWDGDENKTEWDGETEWDGDENKTEWNGYNSDNNRSTTEWNGKGEREIKLLAQSINKLLRALPIVGVRHLYIQLHRPADTRNSHIPSFRSSIASSHIPSLHSSIASSHIHRFAFRPSSVPLALPDTPPSCISPLSVIPGRMCAAVLADGGVVVRQYRCCARGRRRCCCVVVRRHRCRARGRRLVLTTVRQAPNRGGSQRFLGKNYHTPPNFLKLPQQLSIWIFMPH